MAKLTTKERNALPVSSFAGPDRSFPIQDAEHGRKALQLLPRAEKAGSISPKAAARVRAKVHRRYKTIGEK